MHERMSERHVQATLPEPLYQALWQVAKRRDTSIKAAVREAIEAYVRQATPAEQDPLHDFVGAGSLKEGDWARRKDWRA
jgi:hypothetical protein